MGHKKIRIYGYSLLLWILFLTGWYVVERLTVRDGQVYYAPNLMQQCLEHMEQQNLWWGELSLESTVQTDPTETKLPETNLSEVDRQQNPDRQQNADRESRWSNGHRLQLQWQQIFLLDRERGYSYRQGTIQGVRDLNVFREEYGLYGSPKGDLVSCINENWLVERARQHRKSGNRSVETLVQGLLSWNREAYRFCLIDDLQASDSNGRTDSNGRNDNIVLTADLSIQAVGNLFPAVDELQIDWNRILTGHTDDQVGKEPSQIRSEEERISVWIRIDPVEKQITEIRIQWEPDETIRKHLLVIRLFPENGRVSIPSAYEDALRQEE